MSYDATASGTKQSLFSRLVFLLVDLTSGKALVQDAERVIGPDSSRRDSNRPEHQPDRQHDDDGIEKKSNENDQ